MTLPIRIFSTKTLQPLLAAALRSDDRLLYQEADFIRTETMPQEAVAPELPEGAAYIFTSPQAIQAATCLYPKLRASAFRCYCLNGATQRGLAAACPDALIAGTAASAAGLAALILAGGAPGPLLFFCGDRRRDELPDALAAAGVSLEERCVYKTLLQPQRMPPSDAVLFFSPSAVESFLQQNDFRTGAVAFAIGLTTAAAIQAAGGDSQVATRPDPEALLEAVFTHFQTTSLVSTQE